MKKTNTAPISGMQELLPANQAVFDSLKSAITATYRQHGFVQIETPIIDRTEILLAKAGGDTEQQIYFVHKTGDTKSLKNTTHTKATNTTTEAAETALPTEALRFDHTVPLARYTVEHEGQLSFPFKVMQVGRNFRGERAQKGRFREFYQVDADVIGRGTLPLDYDADVIIAALSALQALHLPTPVRARISNRKILTGLLAALNLQGHSAAIYSIIDHAEKAPPEKTTAALHHLGISEAAEAKLHTFLTLHGPTALEQLAALGIDHPTFAEGVEELRLVLNHLAAAGFPDATNAADAARTAATTSAAGTATTSSPTATADTINAPTTSAAGTIPVTATADLRIVRGLDYYTGTVFELFLPEHPEVGSIGGGGRYSQLAQHFTDQPLPGVGASIGLSRLYYILSTHQLLPVATTPLIDYAIIPLSVAEIPYALEVAASLRQQDHSVTLIHSGKHLSDKLKIAASAAAHAIVLGEQEASTHTYEIKTFH